MLVIRAGTIGPAINLAEAFRQSTKEPGDVSHLEGLQVRYRTISRQDYLEIMAKVAKAVEADTPYMMELREPMREMTAAAVAEVHGLRDESGPITIKAEGNALKPEDVALLDDAGLLEVLHITARTYNELDAPAKKRFGQPEPSTSGITPAPSAPQDYNGSAVATAAGA